MTVKTRINEVFNQAPPFVGVNLVALDQPLLDALGQNGADAISGGFLSYGEAWGTAERFDMARLANIHPPVLHTHDSSGRRSDTVEFHPAYHWLMEASVENGLQASTWDTLSAAPRDNGLGEPAQRMPQVERAARLFVAAQVESGHVCPMTMTHASVATLQAAPDRLRDWLPLIRSRAYDPRFLPFWEKRGVTLGMGMTEKQGGTDVRANTTVAVPTSGDEYQLTGHKWFFSAPMSDGFLVLAKVGKEPTAFLVPRFRPDGNVNALHFQRLKDKLGNRSNASAEVEFKDAFAWRIGGEDKGIATILKMVQFTRLDCAVASAGLLRMGTALAIHHAQHRSVFQRKLADQPAMRAVLADLALEQEAATAVALRLAASFDRAEKSPHEAARARVLTPVVKFALCKAAPGFLFEAMECLGGNGYIEDSPMPRLYREAPVNAIWEGAGNVMALDLMRAAGKEAEVVAATLVTLGEETRGLPGAAEAARDVEEALKDPQAEARARFAVTRLAALAATAALVGSAPAEIAEAYARTRLARAPWPLGANDLGTVTDRLIGRALPLI
ncbi:acyl-CoA dehydrogenase family protein [Chelatococcus asaccharovorans]|uniref:acyl-CoA dehydrogenase family protein n=1 Tax=Chelatococcus asaccharovorans TaxID=28210 RepID=UPI00224C792F|nr:acyl-CoA dehydrogenase family protein [Chelatococcus asaccharovorans]CAH1671323.1 putative acyl-CoA dehydrogenase AidB [Chelatococcus asaccharovorans]CAH1677257.1 putative acyl-CoA dehydrogenase AidB [Chelatococcus asaccharovorans]